MDAARALLTFVSAVLAPKKAERFARLVETEKGRKKFLRSLAHGFEAAIRAELPSVPLESIANARCYVFRSPSTFGEERPSIAAAYAQLWVEDAWLLVSLDGRAGVYRPEGRRDREIRVAS